MNKKRKGVENGYRSLKIILFILFKSKSYYINYLEALDFETRGLYHQPMKALVLISVPSDHDIQANRHDSPIS